MSFSLLPLLRFHVLRVMRAEPMAFAAAAAAGALALAAGLALLVQAQRLEQARQEQLRLEARARPAPARAPDPAAGIGPARLPPFRSSLLIGALHQLAADSGLALDEINYALDDNGSQPYLRYRITMSVTSAYPLVRRLAEQASLNMAHVTLDTVHCERKDIVAAELKCDLVMSGFFAKAGRG